MASTGTKHDGASSGPISIDGLMRCTICANTTASTSNTLELYSNQAESEEDHIFCVTRVTGVAIPKRKHVCKYARHKPVRITSAVLTDSSQCTTGQSKCSDAFVVGTTRLHEHSLHQPARRQVAHAAAEPLPGQNVWHWQCALEPTLSQPHSAPLSRAKVAAAAKAVTHVTAQALPLLWQLRMSLFPTRVAHFDED